MKIAAILCSRSRFGGFYTQGESWGFGQVDTGDFLRTVVVGTLESGCGVVISGVCSGSGI